ncbi:MAG TPA: glutathione S-transferase family protein [Kofleriaceae bacterium]|jgi:GST-like protein
MTRSSTSWRILASKGCGSAIAEAAFTIAGVPYERVELDYDSLASNPTLLEHNPLAQVPTAIAPDGLAVAETAALVLIADELAPHAGLLPPLGDPQRRDALRWLVFFVAAIYPTFTYGDNPAKWGSGEPLRAATNAHREAMLRHLDGVARGPWFLGERLSALDVYVGVMANWRPGRAWFGEHAPKLDAIARAVAREPELAEVWRVNGFA